jgi:glycosyltransferase involved in cell wall biosynthesis
MKVCLLVRNFDLSGGGISRVATELCHHLRTNNVDVTVISDTGRSNYKYFANSFFKLKSRIPDSCDVYHAMSPLESMYTPLQKTIVTFHDIIPLIHDVPSHYNNNIILKYIAKECFRIACARAIHAESIVCVSEQTKLDIVNYFKIDPEKIHVIRSGIGPVGYSKEIQDKRRFKYPIIGTLSNLDRRKHIDLLINSVRNSKIINAEIDIAGIGANEHRLKALAGDDDRIVFRGFISDNDLSNYYNSLYLFVFPSQAEGYGLPIVEAMACRIPVVVMKDAFIPDEIKRRCIISENLQETLEYCYRNDATKLVDIESNYEFAKSHNWDSTVKQYTELYTKIAKNQ